MNKEEKIARIKSIIADWGSTNTAELDLDCSPCISSAGTNRMNVSTLVERFNLDDVEIITYNNETEIANDFIPYEDLSEEVIDEVFEIIEAYNMEKIYDSTKDENF